MSHYGINSNNLQPPETSPSSSRRASAFEAEVPLPSYDEAIGEPPGPGFKVDALLPPHPVTPVSRNSRNERTRNETNVSSTNYNQRGSSTKKKLIIVSLGFIILPMCIMIIILQVKVCASSRASTQDDLSRMSNLYQECLSDYNNLRSETEDLHLCKITQADSRTVIENLEDKIKQLKQEIKELRTTTIKPAVTSPTLKKSNIDNPRTEKPTESPVTTEDSYPLNMNFLPDFMKHDPEIQQFLKHMKNIK